jgi:hypothetical protein
MRCPAWRPRPARASLGGLHEDTGIDADAAPGGVGDLAARDQALAGQRQGDAQDVEQPADRQRHRAFELAALGPQVALA